MRPGMHQASRVLPKSVRARTTLIAAVVVALALLGAAAALLATLEHALVRSGDASARTRAGDLTQLAQAGALPPSLPVPREEEFALVTGADGAVVAESPGRSPFQQLNDIQPTGPDPQVWNVREVLEPYGNEREDYRVWAQRAETPQGEFTVYVGYSLESVAETMRTIRRALSIGLPALLLVLGVVIWILVGRALRPVEAIRSEVADISAGALDRRVPVPATRDEIARLASTMNAMLDRLQTASELQRRFVADASHELQSPLASFRTQLEVANAHPETTEWDSMADALLADSQRMERLVRGLLFLARSDEGAEPPAPAPVDLDDIVLEESRRLRPTARVRLHTESVSAAPVMGNRDELIGLVRNLLENAVRHAATTVTVELGQVNGCTRLVVRDDGPGVPPGERERIFERFVRLDAGRSRELGGAGLGLAIAREIARRHHGSIELADNREGASFVVELPTQRQPTLA